MRREIADVLETIKRAKNRDKGCTLLIGAGCSAKAGIPTANGFVEIIRKEYPRAYERAPKKTYPHVMAELLMAERRDLINQYINDAKLNWAHLAIAQLFKHGFVDRVLTVNFDPLVMRACALVGIFPAVYDFAASQTFNPDFIARKSVFYLHGQHTGFVALNTEAEVERLSQHLGPVFSDSSRGRVWIVAGYSGECDPVFDHLVKVRRYDNGLYWICYKDNPPQPHVQEQLLVAGKDCFCIQGYDADDFFVSLAQGLGCFPPTFVQNPFTHLGDLLEPVLPYSQPGDDLSLEAIPKKLLQNAIEKIEKPEARVLGARNMLLAGNYKPVLEMETELATTSSTDLADLVAWGYLLAGNEFLSAAKTKTGEEADRLWVLAGEKYAAALKITPNIPEPLNNWAIALKEQARTKSGKDADRLWALAGKKCEAALKARPDYYDALFNWASALAGQAETKNGEEADRLWSLAGKKYEAALKIKGDDPDALINWGGILDDQARTKSGRQADRLWALASKKYAAALEIKPDHYEGLNNWALVLGEQAQTKSGSEADRLWAQAGEKYEAALKIKPDHDEALHNWGNALAIQAQTKSGKEADRLWTLAGTKYDASLKIKADPGPLMHWADILDQQARTKSGKEADRLWALAGEKYEAALKLKPDSHEVLRNWGLALAVQAVAKRGKAAHPFWELAFKKFEAALKINPDDTEILITWANMLDERARRTSGKEADRVWALAFRKYEAALKIDPEAHDALYNWGLALTAQAETKNQKEATQLLKLADQKLAAAQALERKSS